MNVGVDPAFFVLLSTPSNPHRPMSSGLFSVPSARVLSLPESGPGKVPSVSRALLLLDWLAKRREPMSLARLASDLELPKSSVHGLCNTLVSFGYLRREADGAFGIGPGVMGLAEAFMASTGVAQEFNGLWKDAQNAPDETIVLSVLDGSDVVYVATRPGRRPLGLAFSVGMRLPAHMAATGKAMLAYLEPQTVRQILQRATPHQPVVLDPAEVEALLADAALSRRRGYCIDDEGVRTGVYCVGAPVFDASGVPIAGVGVCIHKNREIGEPETRQREVVLAAARTLTQRLGGRRPAGVPEPA